MKVKALVEHRNEYGDEFVKKVGAEYYAPDRAAEMLVASGLAEAVEAKSGKRA